MRRQLIVMGLAVFAFLLFALISAAVAAPERFPSLQTPETEPNNELDYANSMGEVPGSVTGVVSNTNNVSLTPDVNDCFVMSTTAGSRYQANLSILQNPLGLSVRIRLYDGSQNLIETSSSSSSSASLSWTAYNNSHYIRVEALSVSTTTVVIATYQLDIDELAETPTPTNSSTPTVTPTPTDTPTPTPSPTLSPEDDDYEQNDDFNGAYTLPVATSVELSDLLGVANFYPVGDEDWFRFWAKNGKYYKATTSGLSGVDTYVEIRDQNNGVVESDDDGAGGLASRAEWQATYDGYYYIRIINKVSTTGDYDLAVEESDSPDPTSTPTPGPGPDDEADSCEDNSKFERACIIAPNQAKTFNLVPLYPGGVDNDYYKIWIKPGYMYECFTSNLDPGIDPNMIVYDHNQNGIGGNDDDPRPEAEPGDLNSYFAYYATYEGWLYLLVGTGDRTPSDVYNSRYTLQCNMRVPGEATPTGTPATATPTPAPDSQTATPTPTHAPAATPTSSGELTVRPLTTPTPVPETTPAPQFVPIELLVYYDANDDRQPGAGEGIAGISAQAYEAATNQLLAQGFTGEQGNLEFTVGAQGPVRVSVPFFGFSQLVAGEGASIYLRVPPQPLVGAAP